MTNSPDDLHPVDEVKPVGEADLKEMFAKFTDDIKSSIQPKKQLPPSAVAVAALIITIVTLLLNSGRWTGTTDTTIQAQRELMDLKLKMTEQEISFLKEECKRNNDEVTKGQKEQDDAITLLRTRADTVDRRLNAGGIK